MKLKSRESVMKIRMSDGLEGVYRDHMLHKFVMRRKKKLYYGSTVNAGGELLYGLLFVLFVIGFFVIETLSVYSVRSNGIVCMAIFAAMALLLAAAWGATLFSIGSILGRWFADRTCGYSTLKEVMDEIDQIEDDKLWLGPQGYTHGWLGVLAKNGRRFHLHGRQRIGKIFQVFIVLGCVWVLFFLWNYFGVGYHFSDPTAIRLIGDEPVDNYWIPLHNDRMEPMYMHVNKSAVNVTYQQVVDFVLKDDTDKNQYMDFWWTCAEASLQVQRRAEDSGIRCAIVSVDFSNYLGAHAFDAFNTTDHGVIYIDCTTGDYFSNCTVGTNYTIIPIPGSESTLPDAYQANLMIGHEQEFW